MLKCKLTINSFRSVAPVIAVKTEFVELVDLVFLCATGRQQAQDKIAEMRIRLKFIVAIVEFVIIWQKILARQD